jgi:hypothetical protein
MLSEMKIKELIKSSLELQIKKANKNKKRKPHYSANNNDTDTLRGNFQINTIEKNNAVRSDVGPKHFHFDYTESYNDKHNLPMYYNTNEMIFNLYADLEIPEYTFIPKDERSYYEDYKNYFYKYKTAFLNDLDIKENDPFLDVEKFVLLVTFDNFEGKISLSEMVLVDPLNEYKRYFVKFEQPEIMREYHLFSGQIVYVNGFIKNDEIYVNKIIYGMTLLSFNLQEDYVKKFFTEVRKYILTIGFSLLGSYCQWTDIQQE